MYVAFWGVVASITMVVIRGVRQIPWRDMLQGITTGVKAGATIGVTLATIGIVVKVLNVTGLGVKLPGVVETLSGGNLAIGLILVMLVCIILGMGVPTTAAYILVAIVGAPVLIQMGVDLLPAHFFVFYFAVMALLTPPVAAAAIVSSQLAGASYMSTAMEAVKASVAGFLVPFIFVMNPVFLMQPGQGWLEGTIALLAGLLMLITVASGFLNYYFTTLTLVERLLLLVCSLSCFLYLIILHSYILFAATAVLFIILTLNQLRKWRSSKIVSG
jgi:TRAP-type uncharacterized transport system fused permease subunit